MSRANFYFVTYVSHFEFPIFCLPQAVIAGAPNLIVVPDHVNNGNRHLTFVKLFSFLTTSAKYSALKATDINFADAGYARPPAVTAMERWKKSGEIFVATYLALQSTDVF